MDRQKLLFKVAQVATVKIIKERKGITRLWLKGGIEVKIGGPKGGIGFGVLDADGEMHHFSFDDLQQARETLSRWENAPDWANWLAMDEDGAWWFFECKPEHFKEYEEGGVWTDTGYGSCSRGHNCVNHFYYNGRVKTDKEGNSLDWKSSLEARPVTD